MAGFTDIREPVSFDLESEKANELFLAPAFVSDNIIGGAFYKIMRNVKRTAVMYFAGALSNIVQKNTGCGWTPSGSMAITQREIEVCKEKIQLELCTDEFFDTCFEDMLGNEEGIYQLNETPTGQAILNYWIERVRQGFKNDVWKLSWFGNTDSVLPFFAQCNGWIKQIEADITAGLTPPAVDALSGAPLAAGASVTILEEVIDAQTDILDDVPASDKVLFVSKSIWNNYKKYLQSNPNCCDSWSTLQDGILELRYDGILLIKCSQFDACDATLGNPDTHRVILAHNRTLTMATDITGEETSFSIRFDVDSKLHKIEAYFKQGFNVAHPELIVYAV